MCTFLFPPFSWNKLSGVDYSKLCVILILWNKPYSSLQILDNIKETIIQNCDLQISQMKEKHI